MDLLDIRWVPFVWAIIIVLISIIGYAPFLPLLLLRLTRPVRLLQNLAINNRHHMKRTEYHLASKMHPHTSPCRTYNSLINMPSIAYMHNEIRYRSAHSLTHTPTKSHHLLVYHITAGFHHGSLPPGNFIRGLSNPTHPWKKKTPPCAEDHGPTKVCTTRKSNHPHITSVRSVGETV